MTIIKDAKIFIKSELREFWKDNVEEFNKPRKWVTFLFYVTLIFTLIFVCSGKNEYKISAIIAAGFCSYFVKKINKKRGCDKKNETSNNHYLIYFFVNHSNTFFALLLLF